MPRTVRPPYAGTVVDPMGCTIRNGDGTASITNGVPRVEFGTYSSAKTRPWPLPKGAAIPFNDFTYSYSLEERELGSYGSFNSGYGRWIGYEGWVLTHVPGWPNRSWPDVDINEVLALARGQILDALQDQSVNLGQAFAERHQTVNMLAKSVNRVASAAMAIRKGKFAHASNLLGIKNTKASFFRDAVPSPQNLANHWLEYSYGWRPLLQDIHGSMELLAKTIVKNRPLEISKRAKRIDRFSNYQLYVSDSDGFGAFEFANGITERSARVVVRYAMDNDLAHTFSQTGVSNPINLAWELIPYSFVVDWFVPVGDYLRRLDATSGLSFQSGWESSSKNRTFTSSWINKPRRSESSVMTGSDRTFVSHDRIRRRLTSFPRNDFPSVDPHIGIRRALSGISLLTQAFKR